MCAVDSDVTDTTKKGEPLLVFILSLSGTAVTRTRRGVTYVHCVSCILKCY